MTSLMNTYPRLPVAFVKGSGAYVEDSDGNRYLDALTGLAVCGLGHAHPAVARALSSQAQTLLHTSNLYEIPSQAELAERLCALSGMDKVFFANSGAEANEAAIKIARLHGKKTRHQAAGGGRSRPEFPRPHHGDAHRHRQPQGTGRF